MNKIALYVVVLILIMSTVFIGCKPSLKKYTVVVTESGRDYAGRLEVTDKKKAIAERNDSSAYSNGSRTFFAHKISSILMGLDTNIYKPLFFVVLNEKVEDIGLTLNASTTILINKNWQDMYNKNLPETFARSAQLVKDLQQK